MYNLDWLSTYAHNALDRRADYIMAVNLYVANRKLLKITENFDEIIKLKIKFFANDDDN